MKTPDFAVLAQTSAAALLTLAALFLANEYLLAGAVLLLPGLAATYVLGKIRPTDTLPPLRP